MVKQKITSGEVGPAPVTPHYFDEFEQIPMVGKCWRLCFAKECDTLPHPSLLAKVLTRTVDSSISQ